MRDSVTDCSVAARGACVRGGTRVPAANDGQDAEVQCCVGFDVIENPTKFGTCFKHTFGPQINCLSANRHAGLFGVSSFHVTQQRTSKNPFGFVSYHF